jgi:hypothetical protein
MLQIWGTNLAAVLPSSLEDKYFCGPPPVELLDEDVDIVSVQEQNTKAHQQNAGL